MSGGAPAGVSLLAAALVLAGGLALADLVPLLRERPLLRRLGWAWILGCAWLGGSAYAASHVLGLPLRRGVLLPLVLLPIAAAIARRLLSAAPERFARCKDSGGCSPGLTGGMLLVRAAGPHRKGPG